MSDEELIAAMRDLSAGPSSYLQDVGNAAADRIEALVRELTTSNEVGRAFEEDAGQQRARAERLKAVLQKIADMPDYRLPKPQDIARAALTTEADNDRQA